MFEIRLIPTARTICASLLVLFITLNSSLARAAIPEFSNCLLAASKNQLVSLGQPLASERLAHKTNIQVGVLPFYFKNGEVKQLSEFEKKDYLDAAASIRRMSNNLVSIQIVFLESFKFEKTQDVLKQAFLERDFAWSNQSTKQGTWGFVRDVISAADLSRDFSNLDSVILETNNLDRSFSIAEAMGFYRGIQGNVYRFSNSDFFKSISTQDGTIDNAILFDRHQGVGTIAHEILHNYGLTDLYGSGTGPANLSIMSAGSQSLLNYEKAVLGWFPNEKFQCKNLENMVIPNTVDNFVEISNFRTDSILLLKKTEDVAYLIEVINAENKSLLVVYLLEQELRPPIRTSYDPDVSYASFFDLSNLKFIGSKYRTDDFEVLVTNIKDNSATLNLIPTQMANSVEAKTLIQKSLSNRAEALALQSVKAEADAKAKAEADAKANVEVKINTNLPTQKTTISCIKGKKILKVVAVKPKCPSGYKLKK